MPQAVEQVSTVSRARITRNKNAPAHETTAAFAELLNNVGRPAHAGPTGLRQAVASEYANAGRVQIDDVAARESRTPSKRPRASAAPYKASADRKVAVQSHAASQSSGGAVDDKSAQPLASSGPKAEPKAKARADAPSRPAKQEVSRAGAGKSTPVATRSAPAAAHTFAQALPQEAAPSASRSATAIAGISSGSKALLSKLAHRQKQPVLRAQQAHVPAQVSRALARIVAQGGGKITLRLNPHALGNVRVELNLQHGVAHGRIEADNDLARDLLKRDLDSLRAALERRGVSVQRLEVAEAAMQPPLGGAQPNAEHHQHQSQQDVPDRSAGKTHKTSAESDDHPGLAAEHGAWSGSVDAPVRTDAHGVLRVDALA